MPHDYVEEELGRRSVFKSEQYLSIDYVPEALPHRELELRTLAQSFKTLITTPGHPRREVCFVPLQSWKVVVARSID
ncbi:unnamed protein product, partial [marine sediment metagenome]